MKLIAIGREKFPKILIYHILFSQPWTYMLRERGFEMRPRSYLTVIDRAVLPGITVGEGAMIMGANSLASVTSHLIP
jgi:hypothetical protein